MNCTSGKPLIFDILLYASRIAFSPDVLLYASGEPLIPDVFYADVFFDVGKSLISCSVWYNYIIKILISQEIKILISISTSMYFVN